MADKKPTCIIVLGMAGSGKTTFVKTLTSYMIEQRLSIYTINLDPGCASIPYPVKIDIRDTVKYKDVMKHYNLGPNGAIVTSLNLFATKFTEVLDLLDKRSKETDYIIIDTPGQIEVFTWSASGQIITETLANVYPTVIIYVADSAKCISPVTFMSNMTYSCSIMFKTKLPLVLALNKSDVVFPSFAIKWMTDFQSLSDEIEATSETYGINSRLTYSLSLALDDYYSTLKAVPVSALERTGFDKIIKAIEGARVEYETDYKVAYNKLMERKLETDREKASSSSRRAQSDMEMDIGMHLKSHGLEDSADEEDEKLDIDETDEVKYEDFFKAHSKKVKPKGQAE